VLPTSARRFSSSARTALAGITIAAMSAARTVLHLKEIVRGSLDVLSDLVAVA
jgi:hypothetical protein